MVSLDAILEFPCFRFAVYDHPHLTADWVADLLWAASFRQTSLSRITEQERKALIDVMSPSALLDRPKEPLFQTHVATVVMNDDRFRNLQSHCTHRQQSRAHGTRTFGPSAMCTSRRVTVGASARLAPLPH